MEKASADIFRFIAEHPEKATQIRKFMNYYLPTTLKLLNSYQRLSRQSARGETITSTMFNIAGMMHTVADAFEKQLDSLFGDEALDIFRGHHRLRDHAQVRGLCGRGEGREKVTAPPSAWAMDL